MEPKFQTSFIPKKPILATTSGSMKKSVDFFMVIAVVIFLGSIVLSAGVYTYKFLLEKNMQSLQDSLAKSKDQFDPNFIVYINRLNTRIETSKMLLKQHVSASAIFGFIGDHTLKSISYTDFSYTYGTDGTIKVVMKGIAPNYESIALQSEEFGKQNQYIKSPIFSDLNPDLNGNVVFTLTALLDNNLISYAKTILPGSTNNTATAPSDVVNSNSASSTNDQGNI